MIMAKKYLIKSLLLALLTCAFAPCFAESYITKQEINVRSGPGTSYSITGIIPGDSIIDVKAINGNWATIQYNNQPAYIATKFISKTESTYPNNNTPKSKGSGSNSSIVFYVIGGIVIILVIKFVTGRVSELLGLTGETAFKYRCSNCGRYSTRRGHVFKCNNHGEHDWFKL
jgi:uncharacterized protein YraI